ncbi:hypothetical protein [Aquibacillus halophilus]|uniref:hypothetical protein n=1 Tax=Aquibacillus halophilus TaxID=930132 RepID=UPI00196B7569|nr:hypothetical protein [Aquibacillus halophilus]
MKQLMTNSLMANAIEVALLYGIKISSNSKWMVKFGSKFDNDIISSIISFTLMMLRLNLFFDKRLCTDEILLILDIIPSNIELTKPNAFGKNKLYGTC